MLQRQMPKPLSPPAGHNSQVLHVAELIPLPIAQQTHKALRISQVKAMKGSILHGRSMLLSTAPLTGRKGAFIQRPPFARQRVFRRMEPGQRHNQ